MTDVPTEEFVAAASTGHFHRVDDGVRPIPAFDHGHRFIRSLSKPGRAALIESIAAGVAENDLTDDEALVAGTWLNIAAAGERRR